MPRSRSMADDSRTWWLRLLVSLLLLAGLLVSPLWLALQRFEHDLLASLTAPPRPDAGVVVVGIDEPSLATLELSPPLPRRLHAQLIDALSQAGAAALGVDLLFSAAQSPQDDAALARALQGPLTVVLASAEVEVRSPQVAHYRQRVMSVFSGARHGSVVVPLDDDGVARAAPPQDDALWRVLAQAAGRPVTPPPPGALLRHYAPEVALPYVHYTQALDAARSLPDGALRGRLVLLGQNTPVDGVDRFRTPLHVLGEGSQAGVLLHATALINGLTNDWVVPAPAFAPPLQAVLVVGLAALATRRWRGAHALGWSALLAAVAVLASTWAYVAGVWWSALPTLAGLGLHFNVAAAGSYWRERQRRERLRQEFAQYVPEGVVNELANADMASVVRGERRVLTLLFSDLAGFTAASEHLSPEAVAQALNAYFTRMTACVHTHGGTLDKFIGDAVMAFWNAPLPEPAHARRALACAQDMQMAMEALRNDWQGTPFAAVQLRIGVHTGEAAVGHLGSQARFTYTAVGDAVNTAARLEGANKALHTHILLSGATRDAMVQAGQAPALLWLDCVLLAGRSNGIDVYTPCTDAVLADISQALRGHARLGEWAEALACCGTWCERAAREAPQWLEHAEQMRKRLESMALECAPGEPLRPRALDKT